MVCKFVTLTPMSIWLEVSHGEGNGINNPMTQHIFANKKDGVVFVHHDASLLPGRAIKASHENA